MITTVYTSLLAIGVGGLALQALMGVGHGHHHGQAIAGGRFGGGRTAPGGARGRGPGARGKAAPAGGARGRMSVWDAFAPLLLLLSPLTLFSLCVGAGASGVVLTDRHLAPRLTLLAAVVGGLLFYGLIVRPIWSLAFRFASNPSEALEGTVAHEAVAVSRFEDGKGVVQVIIDGQLVRVLAHLEMDERSRDGAVQPGEKLLVVSVDGRANSCRVMRI